MTEAAQTLVLAEQATEAAETALKEAKERERLLREETLPGMLNELGVENLTLLDGSAISMKQEVYCSITEEKKAEAFKWIEDNGFGGIIKTVVSVPFGKGEIEKAMDLLVALEEMDIPSGYIDRSVHAQTLKAFVKERLGEMGEVAAEQEARKSEPPSELKELLDEMEPARNVIPLELFGARPVMTAKVKAPTIKAKGKK